MGIINSFILWRLIFFLFSLTALNYLKMKNESRKIKIFSSNDECLMMCRNNGVYELFDKWMLWELKLFGKFLLGFWGFDIEK